MIVELSQSDILTVKFRDTDGEFRIHFDSAKYPMTVTVEETDGCPDTEGRSDIIYQEHFSEPDTGGCHICDQQDH